MSGSTPVPLEASLPALVAAGSGTLFSCSLCGHAFTHGGRVCGACPVSSGCDLVKCPNCGFQFPRSSKIAAGISRLWSRWRRSA
jgi:hypothetical protein